MSLPATRAVWVGFLIAISLPSLAGAGPSVVGCAPAGDSPDARPPAGVSPVDAGLAFDSGQFLRFPAGRSAWVLDAPPDASSPQLAAVPLPPAAWSGLATVAVVAVALALGNHRRARRRRVFGPGPARASASPVH